MSSLPINRIFDLRNEIHKNISQVYANKIQCERLCERIDQLIDPLERLEYASSTILRDETRPILEKLLQCIDDCNNYMDNLKSPNQWFEEIYEYKKSEEKFHELNQRLSQLGQDLSLGLNIQQLFDRTQDQLDQHEDLKDLNKKLDEISQKMLDKQCQQYKLIDKMIDKRFQSFRFYLTQNLSMQQDPDYQQFLHIPYKDLYIEDQPLGNGGFADVYKATWLTHQSSFQIVGSFYWKAPELLTGHTRHTKQSDVYSLGMVYWELGTERKPWDEYDDETIILIQVKIGERPIIPADIPEQYKQLIQNAWNHDPQKRPTCFQLMEQIYQVINSTNQSMITINEKDVIDLHPQPITTEQYHSVISNTQIDSTRTAIEAVEEQNLTDSLPNISISEPLQSEITTDNLEQTDSDQIESESIIKPSASCSSLNDIELQNQTSASFTPSFERTLSKSVDDIPSTFKAENDTHHSVNQTHIPIYRIEKRRPLHDKSIWARKKN